MKGFSTLSKHIFIYIAICVISFILVSTICYKADYKHIYNYYSDRLYLQANEIANEYALDYLAESKLRRIELEMKSLSTFNDTRIMFITPSGDVILDTNNSSTDKSNEDRILFSINDFDYGDLKGKHDILWDFYGLFSEPALSVFSPISNSFEIKGYVVINIPESAIVERVYDTFNTNYLTLAIVLILSSAFLVLYFFQVHRPIKEITMATNEYSKGNLSYHVKPMLNDEIGLFLLYGYYRAVNQPQMSVVLTIASLGTRVALAYLLSATPLGVTGIWLSVPIGWALADAIGIGYYLKKKR